MNDVIYHVLRLWNRGMLAVPVPKKKQKNSVPYTSLCGESCEQGFLIAPRL